MGKNRKCAAYMLPRDSRPPGLQANSTFHPQSLSGLKRKKGKKNGPVSQDVLARVVGTLAPLQLVKTSLGDWLREPRFIAAFCSCVSLRCTWPAHSCKLPSASRVAGRPISPFVDDSVLPDELRAQPSLRGAAVALVSSTPVTHYFATAATWLEVCVRACLRVSSMVILKTSAA